MYAGVLHELVSQFVSTQSAWLDKQRLAETDAARRASYAGHHAAANAALGAGTPLRVLLRLVAAVYASVPQIALGFAAGRARIGARTAASVCHPSVRATCGRACCTYIDMTALGSGSDAAARCHYYLLAHGRSISWKTFFYTLDRLAETVRDAATVRFGMGPGPTIAAEEERAVVAMLRVAACVLSQNHGAREAVFESRGRLLCKWGTSSVTGGRLKCSG